MATDPAMKITPPYTPELLPEVVCVIEEYLGKCDTPMVLELGSGWSTVWFALKKCHLISVEHAIDWAASVGEAIALNKLAYYVYLLCVPPWKFPLFCQALPDEAFDLVYIDCVDEQRVPCLSICQSKVKQGGWLVIDDSHWDILKPEIAKLVGFESTVISGMHTRKTGEVKFHQTTILEKIYDVRVAE